MTDIEVLRRSGELLYGPRWQTDLARDLGVTNRSLRRWIAHGDIPDTIVPELLRLLRRRQARIARFAAQVERGDT